MNDIVNALRKLYGSHPICQQAADEIERLRMPMTTYGEAVRRAMKNATEAAKAANPSLDSRTSIAIGLWHKFADPNHIDWEDETHKAEYLMAVDDITTRQLLDLLLGRVNFDGMDPNTFTIGELQRAI